MFRVLIAVVFITIIVSLLGIWFYPSMQDFMYTNATWNGIKRFSGEFKAEIVESIDALSGALDEPETKALIAIPTQDYNVEELLRIKNFIYDGGTLLLLDDYGYGNTILSYLDLAIVFSKSTLLDPLFSYKNQKIPRITDFIPELTEGGINVLMFNHATSLRNVADSEALAWSSKASFLDMDRNGSLSTRDIRGPLVVAAQVKMGKGAVVIISDSSIIVNSMVGRDNNYDFIKYFTEGKRILIDGSHIARLPLDIFKTRLSLVKRAFSSPYALVGLTAFIFIAVYRYTSWGGESAG